MKQEIEVFIAFLIGICVGVIGLGLLVKYSDTSATRYHKAIAECEKSLPRDQHCVVVGVPEVKE